MELNTEKLYSPMGEIDLYTLGRKRFTFNELKNRFANRSKYALKFKDDDKQLLVIDIKRKSVLATLCW